MTTEGQEPLNESAFPFVISVGADHVHTGMTLRDYFAAAALQGMIADCDDWQKQDEYAQKAYGYADAMLKARKEGV